MACRLPLAAAHDARSFERQSSGMPIFDCSLRHESMTASDLEELRCDVQTCGLSLAFAASRKHITRVKRALG